MSQTNTTKKTAFVGDGVDNSPYSWPYPLNDENDIKVIYKTDATGDEVVKTINTQYTVSVADDKATATITLDPLTTPPASGESLVLVRNTQLTQESTYDRHPTLEPDLDKRTQAELTLQEQADRSLKMSITDGMGNGQSAFDTTLPAIEGATGGDSLRLNSGKTAMEWDAVEGDVTGPSTSTDNAIARWDGTDGDLLQDSGVLIDDSNNMSGVGTLDVAQVNWAKGADVASANALTLGTDGNVFDITGTTAITSIGTLGVGTTVLLQFDGILTLTHDGDNIDIPGDANITTAAGDTCIFYEYATGKWRVQQYQAATGGSPTIPSASTTVEGIIELATQAEVDTGTDTTRAVTPDTLTNWSGLPSGDVTAGATITDNRVVRGDVGAKGIQESGVTLDDSDNMSGVGTLDTTGAITVDIGAYAQTPDVNADNLSVQESSSQVGISIIGTATGNCNLFFGDSAAPAQGRIIYENSGDTMNFRTAGVERFHVNATELKTVVESLHDGASAGHTAQSATGDGATTIDWGAGNLFLYTAGASPNNSETFTFTAPTNPGTFILKFINNAAGDGAVTGWPASVKWPSGTAPTITASANAVDIIHFVYDGTNYYGTSAADFS